MVFYKRSLVLLFSFFVLLFSFMASGCSDGDDEVGRDAVLDMKVEGRIYNNDPSGRLYEESYGDSPVSEMINDADGGDAYAKFLLGFLYVANYPSYGVERDVEKGLALLKSSWVL